ncbi:MAG TPA: hypothetical protein VFU63_11425 [Ktedonobacterales bacterium]|nr:hypothetical protein [Ktedonobacterales bacterium]
MNTQQFFFFTAADVIPAVLFPVIAALVAIGGASNGRRTLAVLSLVGLALLLFGGFAISTPIVIKPSLGAFDAQWIALPALFVGLGICRIGEVYALILTTRARDWLWFAAILIAAVIGAIAALFVLNANVPYAFLATLGQRSTISQLPYVPLIFSALSGVTLIAQLLYALIGLRGTTNAATSTFADEVTLP